MSVKIERKIKSASVVKENEAPAPEPTVTTPAKPLKRPAALHGTTYKIKPPTTNRTNYITINDDENGKPFEIFINTKHVEHQQWTSALTRILSAAFRRDANINYLIEELKQVFDPTGNYFLRGRNYPSVVAHIGWVIDEHINGYTPTKADKQTTEAPKPEAPKGQLCSKCNQYTLIKLDGCDTCTNCGDSKCG